MVVKLQRVTISTVRCLIQSDPGATLSWLPVFINDSHYSIREVAFSHIEVKAVHRYQFGKRNVISLFFLVRQVIPENEPSLFGSVCVEITEHHQVFVDLGMVSDDSLRRINCRVVFGWRILIEPVQIEPASVQSVVSAWNSIRVQNRNNLEHEVFEQTLRLLVFQTTDMKMQLLTQWAAKSSRLEHDCQVIRLDGLYLQEKPLSYSWTVLSCTHGEILHYRWDQVFLPSLSGFRRLMIAYRFPFFASLCCNRVCLCWNRRSDS